MIRYCSDKAYVKKGGRNVTNDKVSLSVLWGVLDEYWMCLFDEVLLSVLWVVFGEYWMCVLGNVSLCVF